MFTGSYPQFASIKRQFITTPSGSCDERDKTTCGHNTSYFSLKTILNHYRVLHEHHALTSTLEKVSGQSVKTKKKIKETNRKNKEKAAKRAKEDREEGGEE